MARQMRQPTARNASQTSFVPRLESVAEFNEQNATTQHPHGSIEQARVNSPYGSLSFETFVPPEPSTRLPSELQNQELQPTRVVEPSDVHTFFQARDLFRGVRSVWNPQHPIRQDAAVLNENPPSEETQSHMIGYQTNLRSGTGFVKENVGTHHHQPAPPTFRSTASQPAIGTQAPRRQLFPDMARDYQQGLGQFVYESGVDNMNRSNELANRPSACGLHPRAESPTFVDPDTLGGVALPQTSAPIPRAAEIPRGLGNNFFQQISTPISQPPVPSQDPAKNSLHQVSAFVSRPLQQLPTSVSHPSAFPARFANMTGTDQFKHDAGSAPANPSAVSSSGFQTQAETTAATSSTMRGNAASFVTADSQGPQLTPDEKRARAKALAEFIKAGGLEKPGMDMPPWLAQSLTGPTVPSVPFSSVPSSSAATQQPGFGRAEPTPPTFAHGNNTFVGYPLRISDPMVDNWRYHGAPTWLELTRNLVFAETARDSKPHNFGVLKITDIPYNVTKEEILQLVGDRAPIVQKPIGSKTTGIHIIMERATAKSMDCFVEFDTPRDAEATFNRLDASTGRRIIQNRRVHVSFSSQDALMKEVFPRAKCVTWAGGNPVIAEPKDAHSAAFRGFVTNEEMVMTTKFGQSPQRSRFALRHPQRPFESIISLVLKYPWHAIFAYTLGERDLIFKTTHELIVTLANKLQRSDEARAHLDWKLLDDMLQTGLICPGFSEKQRAELVDAAAGVVTPRVYVSQVAHSWPFEVLNRKSDASVANLMYQIDLLKQGTTPMISTNTTLSQVSAMGGAAPRMADIHFGNFVVPYPEDKSKMTMAEVALLEWQTVENVLRKFAEK